MTEQSSRPLSDLSPEELTALAETQRRAHADQAAKGTKLDVTRGKPSSAQLDLANPMLSLPSATTDRAGTDVRNYGGLTGLTELREIFAELLWVEPEQIVAGGNSSLTMMRDVLVDLEGAFRTATQIIFSPEETIRHAAIGDSGQAGLDRDRTRGVDAVVARGQVDGAVGDRDEAALKGFVRLRDGHGCAIQDGRDLGRVVRVVVVYRDACGTPLVFEAASDTAECLDPHDDIGQFTASAHRAEDRAG